MKERDFSLYDLKRKIRLTGGILWKSRPRGNDGQMWDLDTKTKTLSVYLCPNDSLNDVRDHLFDMVREHNFWLHLYFSLQKRVPSLLILVPASLTVFLIAFGAIFGDSAVAIAFTEGSEDTVFGISRWMLFVVAGGIATLLLYSFPAFFSGEQEGFVQYINERFSRRGLIKDRFKKVFRFLRAQNVIKKVVIWNPHFSEESADWVTKSLIPGAVESRLEVELQIKIDERNTAQNYVAQITRREPDEIIWDEQYFDEDAASVIPYDYLEGWEKRILAIYSFASTANLPPKWKAITGGLKNAVSLALVELIIEQFKERLFSESDIKELISLDTFASRCVNDFGVLEPCLRYSRQALNVWELADGIVQTELTGAQDEMRYVYSFLETNLKSLSEKIQDPVAALILCSLYTKTSIYSDKRLAAIRYFIQVMRDTEQYKLFKVYWESVVTQPDETRSMGGEGDLYRILGVQWLMDTAVLFEKAAMYHHATNALDFIERVYPYRGKVGKARVTERQGNYEGSVKALSQIKDDYQQGILVLDKASVIDLYLNIAWSVVSGRLEKYRLTGRQLLAEAQTLLYSDFDKLRISEYITRLYNITANFEEWEGNLQGALENYTKALQIPGAEQSGLSNLLVNNGIALRMVGRLHEAARYGEQGCEIKAAIGDADQLPIALHNLAQTYILLAYSMPAEGQKSYFEKALKHAQTGLDIQSQTGSVKKRGQLLSEKFIAHTEIARAEKRPLRELKPLFHDVRDWLKEEVKEGRGGTYDCKVVTQELLGILPEFANKTTKTAEEAARWEWVA